MLLQNKSTENIWGALFIVPEHLIFEVSHDYSTVNHGSVVTLCNNEIEEWFVILSSSRSLRGVFQNRCAKFQCPILNNENNPFIKKPINGQTFWPWICR